MDEFGLDEQGRLDLFGVPDEQLLAGWDPPEDGDPATDPGDDEDAWLRSMPAELRAEVLARPPLPVPPPGQRAAGLWDLVGGAAAFAEGGFCDTMLPGSVLADLLAATTDGGFAQLSDDALTGMLRGWQRQISHCHSAQARLVAELTRRRMEQARRPGWSRIAEHVVDELQAELTLTAGAAGRLADIVAGLERLPEVNDALLSGFIDWARACVLVDELAVLDDVVARQIAERLADQAAGWTTGQLRAALARAVLAADPQAAERRRKRARHDTRVDLWREQSGNAALAGRELRPANAIVLDRKLDSDADWLSACGVPGTRGELRALAYTTLLSGRELATILDDPSRWPKAERDGARDGASGHATAREHTTDNGAASSGAASNGPAVAAAGGDRSPGDGAAGTAAVRATSHDSAADRVGARGSSTDSADQPSRARAAST